MKLFRLCLYYLLLPALLFTFGNDVFAAAVWNKTNEVGYWRFGTNWSSAPNAPSLTSGGTYVTNLATKSVIVDAATPDTNLFIGSLNVWAPADSTNTLILQDLAPRSLVTSNNSLDVRMRGAIIVTNSSLVVTGNFIAFNIWAGSVTLDSGSILARNPGLETNSTIPTRIGRTNVAELVINGGIMEVGALSVGQAGFPTSRSHGTIRMNGGELLVLGELSIGNSANCTGVVHLAGGLINVPIGNTNVARVGDDGVGLMTISNATAMLNNLSVGRHTNSLGTLAILPTGLLDALDDVSVGRFGGSTGQLFMAGGELRCTNQTLWIGREGRGELVVSNGLIRADNLHVASLATNGAQGTALFAGGIVTLASNILIGAAPITTGDVVIAGGTLTATNPDYSAVLDLSSGSLTQNGGTLAIDHLSLTNSAGRFQFNAGVLQSRFSHVANGVPFVVGDGVNAATFILGPGSHVFQNGLVVSPNATLTGCGDITGTVVNNGGTINTTNCRPFDLLRFTQHPSSLTTTQGAMISFVVAAVGTPAPEYQWRFTPLGGVEANLLGATSPLFPIANVEPSHAGAYRAVATNPSGSITSTVATLRVLLPATLHSATYTTAKATVSFESVVGLIYVLEYKDQLGDPIWTPLGSTQGTGGILTLEDTSPALQTRFYRVRVE